MATDTFRDALIDGDRDIVVAAGDIQLTQDVYENVSQSVAILAGDTIRDVLGGQLTPQSVERVRFAVEEALQNDIQIENVVTAEVTEINKVDNSVEVLVVLQRDTDFTIEVNV